jgi:hypothetical protein
MTEKYRHHRLVPWRRTAAEHQLRSAANRFERHVAVAVAIRVLQLMAAEDALTCCAMPGEFDHRELRAS